MDIEIELPCKKVNFIFTWRRNLVRVWSNSSFSSFRIFHTNTKTMHSIDNGSIEPTLQLQIEELAKQGQLERATTLFKETLAVGQQYNVNYLTYGYNLCGHYMQHKHDYHSAIDAFTNAIQLYEIHIWNTISQEEKESVNEEGISMIDVTSYPLYQRTLCYEHIRAYDNAITDLNTAISLKLSREFECKYRHFKIRLLAASYKFKEALDEITIGIQMETDNIKRAELHFFRASVYTDLGKNKQGLRSINKSINLDPSLSDSHVTKARICEKLKQYDEGLKSINQAIEIAMNDNPNAELFVTKANILYSIQQYAEAAIEYTNAMNLTDSNIDKNFWLSRRALCHYNNNEYKEAVVDINTAIQLAPDVLAMYITRATIYGAIWETTLATNDCDFVLNHNQRNNELAAEAWYARSQINDQIERINNAIEDCTRAVELAPKNLNLLNILRS
jgi:tetratricopeptide (TPR) repeat protein